ncbi:hypothetical protein L873DRAFT_1804907, partial [Choiromyces venosus 120613-1]
MFMKLQSRPFPALRQTLNLLLEIDWAFYIRECSKCSTIDYPSTGTQVLYSRTPLSRMVKIRRISPGQRMIQDGRSGFGAKKFRIRRDSSGTTKNPV